jgi:hypothetical protein
MAGAYDELSAENRRKVDRLLADTQANDGLAPVDLDAFWRDQALARANPFGRTFRRFPLVPFAIGNASSMS